MSAKASFKSPRRFISRLLSLQQASRMVFIFGQEAGWDISCQGKGILIEESRALFNGSLHLALIIYSNTWEKRCYDTELLIPGRGFLP